LTDERRSLRILKMVAVHRRSHKCEKGNLIDQVSMADGTTNTEIKRIVTSNTRSESH
jgi:hypothetical protein